MLLLKVLLLLSFFIRSVITAIMTVSMPLQLSYFYIYLFSLESLQTALSESPHLPTISFSLFIMFASAFTEPHIYLYIAYIIITLSCFTSLALIF